MCVLCLTAIGSREFRTLESKWGSSQELGTSGGEVSYSFATRNYNGQLRDFDSFITQETFQKEIIDGLAAWETFADIRFLQTQDASSVDIRFGWRDIDGGGSILGETVFPSTGPLNQVVVAFDINESWFVNGDSPPNQIDFSSTAIHEIGHAIGIDHSEKQQAIMNSSYSTDIFSLQTDDIDAATNIYGSNGVVRIEVHRFYKNSTGSHLFTSDLEEKVVVEQISDFDIEGVGFSAISRNDEFVTGTIPIYRFFNENSGGHLFTSFEAEKDYLLNESGFIFEGVGFRAFARDTASTVAVHRFFNKETGGHFFTASELEKMRLLSFHNLDMRERLFTHFERC